MLPLAGITVVALEQAIAAPFATRQLADLGARVIKIAFVDHPQLTARHRWRTVDSPVGPLRALLPPVTISGVEPNIGAIPALGEHTADILKGLGFDAAQIAVWKQVRAQSERTANLGLRT